MARNPNITQVVDPYPGYNAWCRGLLEPENACKLFEGYAEALTHIATKREALRQADLHGPIGKTAGWSPSGNIKIQLEMPYVAMLLLKAALGRDALQDPKKRRFIAQQHPEFDMTIRR
jgi:hypothetical protein